MKLQKTNLFILALILCVAGFTACKDDGEQEPTKLLAGTKWKLVKLMHTATKVERPIFVGDDICTELVPTLDFETQTTGFLQIMNKNPIPFDLNKNEGWFNHPTMEGGYDLIGEYIKNLPHHSLANIVPSYHSIGYKVEGGLLKLYYYDDGFFYFDTNCNIIEMHKCTSGEYVTDSNWYNCAVFEEIIFKEEE